jgi:hypothetical protein
MTKTPSENPLAGVGKMSHDKFLSGKMQKTHFF